MNPELADDLRQIEAIKAEARALVAALSEDQLNRRPGPKRWSVAQCLHHLNAIRTILPAIDRTIEAAERRGLRSPGPFRYGWFARWSVRAMEPPPRFRMRTVTKLLPRDTPLRAGDVLSEFLELREKLGERVRRSDGLDLKRAVVVSPVNRLVRLPLGAYFAFLLAHDRRHLWQARQVVVELGFAVILKPLAPCGWQQSVDVWYRGGVVRSGSGK
jgi:hypothetical protein